MLDTYSREGCNDNYKEVGVAKNSVGLDLLVKNPTPEPLQLALPFGQRVGKGTIKLLLLIKPNQQHHHGGAAPKKNERRWKAHCCFHVIIYFLARPVVFPSSQSTCSP